MGLFSHPLIICLNKFNW